MHQYRAVLHIAAFLSVVALVLLSRLCQFVFENQFNQFPCPRRCSIILYCVSPIYNNKFNSYKFHIYFCLFFSMLFVLFPGSISPARLSSVSFSSVSVASNIIFKSLNAFSNGIESLLAFRSIAAEDATNVIITTFVVGVHL